MAQDKNTTEATGHTAAQVAWEDMPWSNVTLEPISMDDAETFYKWQNDPNLRDLSMGYRMPIQLESVREWINSLRTNRTRAVYGVHADGQLCGMVNLFDIDMLHRQCSIGFFIAGADGFQSGDLAVVSGIQGVDFALNGLNLHRLNMEAIEINIPAIRGALALGFEKEGRKRKAYYADGRYWDTLCLGLLAEDFHVTPPPQMKRLCRRLQSSKDAFGGVFL